MSSSSDFLFLSNSTTGSTLASSAKLADERRRSKSDVSTTSSLDSPVSASDQPPLLQPCASRLISCLRAPCLKRQSSGHTSPNGSTTPPSGAVSPTGNGGYGSGSDSNNVSCYSFASIKRVLAAPPSRHVHFDAAPPEAGITYSRDNYDRRPIECTRGGSSFDLSLPPRGMCPSYSGEADDERCGGDVDEEGDEVSNKERIRGFARWARLKNGGTILGGATLRYTPNKNNEGLQQQSLSSSSEAREPNTCSLPVHGIRSFGGLAGSIGHENEVHSIEEDTPKGRRRTLLSEMDDGREAHNVSSSQADTDDMDEEHAAFRQAVYRALSMSPNATPMPSPSVKTRWECVTSFFESADIKTKDLKENSSDAAATSPEETSTPIASRNVIPQAAETDSCAEVDHVASASLAPSTTKISPSSSIESSNAHSSSPMSSRCSSTDTWSSQSNRDAEVDEFERSFGTNVGELQLPKSIAIAVQDTSTGSVDGSATFVIHGSQIESTDASEEHAISSSSTISGSGGDWISSCATSPELGSSDDLAEPAGVQTKKQFSLDCENKEVPLSTSSSPSRCCSSFSLLSPARRAISHSAPGSTSHSPCVQSADEAETDEGASNKLLIAPLLQRSNSCSRKPRMKQRRFASSGDSPADSDDNGLPRPIRRSTSGQRSKSMSSAAATVKKSNFSASSFRSELEDEGALGGF
jgi:hypothetical protein